MKSIGFIVLVLGFSWVFSAAVTAFESERTERDVGGRRRYRQRPDDEDDWADDDRDGRFRSRDRQRYRDRSDDWPSRGRHNDGFPYPSQRLRNEQRFDQRQGTGQAAAAGDARAKNGNVMSINTANQQANRRGSIQDAVSANSAQGDEVAANGVAQVKGGFQGNSGRRRGSSKTGKGRQSDRFRQTEDYQQGTGQAAAAGDAKARQGNVMSINQANQQSDAQGTRQSAISANSASGSDISAGGAAQAGGNFTSGSKKQSGHSRRRIF